MYKEILPPSQAEDIQTKKSGFPSLKRETQKLEGSQHPKTFVDKVIWKRIRTWIIWSYIYIDGDTLHLSIKFGDVGTALKAFKYYTTGSDPHRNRR